MSALPAVRNRRGAALRDIGATGSRAIWRLRALLLPVVGIAGALGAWQLTVSLSHASPFVLPSPAKVALALKRGVFTTSPHSPASFLYQGVPTIEVTVLGFLAAAATGIILGVVVSEFRVLRQALWPLIVAFQALPKVALAPIMVVWFGVNLQSKIILVLTVSFFPVFVNTIVGVESLHEDTAEMLRSFGAKRPNILRFGRLPAALPVIFAGLQSAILFSLVAVVVAEFVAGSRGWGVQITQAQYNLDIAAVFGILLLFALTGVVLSMLVKLLEYVVVVWNR
jgi:NitT/TauT family transport system permease protein